MKLIVNRTRASFYLMYAKTLSLLLQKRFVWCSYESWIFFFLSYDGHLNFGKQIYGNSSPVVLATKDFMQKPALDSQTSLRQSPCSDLPHTTRWNPPWLLLNHFIEDCTKQNKNRTLLGVRRSGSSTAWGRPRWSHLFTKWGTSSSSQKTWCWWKYLGNGNST